MSNTLMCTWCASTEHSLSDCPIAPKPGIDFVFDDAAHAEGLNLVSRFKMYGILNIIKKLDSLPPDHEPDKDDLWEAIRRIEDIAKGYSQDE